MSYVAQRRENVFESKMYLLAMWEIGVSTLHSCSSIVSQVEMYNGRLNQVNL